MKMRKIFVFCAVIAGIALMAGCQKEEQGNITLKAVIDPDTKAYLGTNNYPYWDSDDQVKVNGTAYGLTNPTNTYATITGVSESENYYAVYPSSIVQSMSGNTAIIHLPAHQEYKWVGNEQTGYQRLDMPMAAMTNSDDKLLQFKNLCGIVRVNVKNAITGDDAGEFEVKRISINANSVFIAGYATATIGSESTTLTRPTQVAYNTVTLSSYSANNNSLVNMGTLASNASKSFDLVVPPLENTPITIRVETNRGYYTVAVSDATLSASKIARIAINVDQLDRNDAYLVDGPTFSSRVRSLTNNGTNHIVTVAFNYGFTPQVYDATNSTITVTINGVTNTYNVVELQTNDSPNKIYGYLAGTQLNVVTPCTTMYANPNCSHMFFNLNGTADVPLVPDTYITNIGLGQYLRTDLVTDMSYMFAGNSVLNPISGLDYFNTSNVTNMSHMFENVSTLATLDLSNFRTSNVTNMEGMFKGCTTLRSIDLTNAYTSHVTNMINMFQNCTNMGDLYINHFDMSNVSDDNKANMCSGLAGSHTSNWRCNIFCNDNVYNVFHATGNPTGIDLTKVTFPNHTSSK